MWQIFNHNSQTIIQALQLQEICIEKLLKTNNVNFYYSK